MRHRRNWQNGYARRESGSALPKGTSQPASAARSRRLRVSPRCHRARLGAGDRAAPPVCRIGGDAAQGSQGRLRVEGEILREETSRTRVTRAPRCVGGGRCERATGRARPRRATLRMTAKARRQRSSREGDSVTAPARREATSPPRKTHRAARARAEVTACGATAVPGRMFQRRAVLRQVLVHVPSALAPTREA